jgi:hypothetical protein
MPGGSDRVGLAVAALVVVSSLAGAAWIVAAGVGSSVEVVPAAPPLDPDRVARYGSHDDDVVFIVGVIPGRLQVAAVPSDSTDVPARDLAVRVNSEPVDRLADCGWNCVTADAPVLQGSPAFVGVEVRRTGKPTARVALGLPAAPPPAAGELYRRVSRRMASIRSVRIHETLSDGTTAVRTTFAFRAPNLMRYETSSGTKAVLIGRRRWDWEGGRWTASAATPIRSPAYNWSGARRPRLLPSSGGLRVLSVFRDDPRFPALFRLYVDARERVVRAHMLSVGHFMVDRLSGFDEPVAIEPPR